MVKYQPTESQTGELDALLTQYGALCEIIIKNYPYVEPPREVREDEDENEYRFVFEFEWTPNMLSNFFIIACRARKHDLISKQLAFYLQNQQKIPGELRYFFAFLLDSLIWLILLKWMFMFIFWFNSISEQCLMALFEEFYAIRNVPRAVDVLNLVSRDQNSHLVADYTTRLRSLTNLSPDDR